MTTGTIVGLTHRGLCIIPQTGIRIHLGSRIHTEDVLIRIGVGFSPFTSSEGAHCKSKHGCFRAKATAKKQICIYFEARMRGYNHDTKYALVFLTPQVPAGVDTMVAQLMCATVNSFYQYD